MEIIGPIVALLLSITFTVWHTRSIRREDRRYAHRQAFTNEAETWANELLNLCNQIKESMKSDEWENVTAKKRELVDSASRLSTNQTFGIELPKYILGAMGCLISLPDDRKWNDQEVQVLREHANTIKDLTAVIKW